MGEVVKVILLLIAGAMIAVAIMAICSAGKHGDGD